MKTVGSQDIMYTSMTDNMIVTFIKMYPFISNLIPSVETQIMFNETTQNKYKISFDEYFTETQVLKDLLVQHDMGSAQQVNSPKQLVRAHQMKDRIDTPNKNNNIAIFDNLDLRKYYVESDGKRYPRDNVSINYTEKD